MDALGHAVESNATAKTLFLYGASGAKVAKLTGGTLTAAMVPLTGGETAVYNASGLQYVRHTDWLGSSRLATTWAHAVYSKESYAPFGETYNEFGTADRSFTGQEQDTVTGNLGSGTYDFPARSYDPAAGRWLSPDPLGWGAASAVDPQSLNRYAYVKNQPMNLVDPNGEYFCAAGISTSDIVNPGTWCYNSDGYGMMLEANPGDGQIMQNGQILSEVGTNGDGGDPLYMITGTYYYAPQIDWSSIAGMNKYVKWYYAGDANAGNDMKYDIFHCPSCVNTWKQSNCVVSKPLQNAMSSTAKGAVGTAFKAGVSNGGGWSGFLPAAWNAVKDGTVTAGAALWTYANVIYDTANYTVNGCQSE